MQKQGFVEASTLKFYLAAPMPDGDGACMALEEEQNEVFNKRPSSIMDALKNEITKRGLKWQN